MQLNLGGMGFGGACGYHAASQAGLLYSELFADTPQFRMYKTFVSP